VEKEKEENGEINEGIQIWIWRVFGKPGHTTSGWICTRRAREPVEVPWARKYFLVSWEANPVR